MNRHFRAIEERAQLEVSLLEQIQKAPNITALELSKLFKTSDTNVRKTLLPYLKDGLVAITDPKTISYRMQDGQNNS